MTEESPQKNNNTNILIGGLAVVGLSVGGLFLAQNNAQVANDTNVQTQTEQVANLPAVSARLDSIEALIEDHKDERSQEINRREMETYNYIDKLDEKQIEIKEDIVRRVERLEQEIFDSVP